MTPRIKSGQLVTCAPMTQALAINIGGIVLCTVKGRQCIHLVSAVGSTNDRYQISNNQGLVNGWIDRSRIPGFVVEIAD